MTRLPAPKTDAADNLFHLAYWLADHGHFDWAWVVRDALGELKQLRVAVEHAHEVRDKFDSESA